MQILYIYFAVISAYSAFLAIYDKIASKRGSWRVKESALLISAALGGAVAMLIAMLACRHKTRHAKFMAGLPLIIIAQALLVCAFDARLSVSRITVETDLISQPVTFALITDLHSCYYGKGQKDLTDSVLKEKPDIILLGGDIYDITLPLANTEKFISGVSGKAPVYYVTGNHEFWGGQADIFKRDLKEEGVRVLEGDFDDITIRGQRLRICGIDDPEIDRFSKKGLYKGQLKKLEARPKDSVFTILLAHRPERIEEYCELGFDLVLSGHAHGGQWRLPFLLRDGLYAPNQGLFPSYASGAHFFGETEMIVSRGLARETTWVPRIFNRPEIVMVTVK